MTEPLFLGVCVIASIGLVVYSLMGRKGKDNDVLRRRLSGQRPEKSDNPLKPKPQRSAARDVLEKVAPYAMKPVMPGNDAEMSKLRERLSQAGFRREDAVRYLLASKTLLGIGVTIVAFLACAMLGGMSNKQTIGVAIFAGGCGFILPNFWLSLAISRRQDKIRNGLPDSLDLMVVSVESGLALDATLQKVGDDMRNVHTELSEEMTLAVYEGQMGVPRMEALEKMAKRCGVDEVRGLVSVISQAERFGTSVAKALRTQADSLRTKRRLKAEERAQKTTVKLMVPLILFIFPSIFVVLVGPAAMQLIKAFTGGSLS